MYWLMKLGRLFVMMSDLLMMLAQNVCHRKKYKSYYTFQVIFFGHFTGNSTFKNLVILARCIASNV